MGFRCPVCYEEFKQDKVAWQKHCRNAHAGMGDVIRSALRRIAGESSKRPKRQSPERS